MRICLQLIENYLNQEVPTIILTIEKQKYIFNMASCFQRFIKDHRQKFPSGARILFTRANTDTLAGLSGLMLTIFENRNCQDTKLFVTETLYNYLEEIRYKMGFKILPYSYINLFDQSKFRTGIRDIDKVYSLVKDPNFPTIFLNSEQYIQHNIIEQDRNEAHKLMKQPNVIDDGEIRIVPFAINYQSNPKETIVNYICIPNRLEGKVLMNQVKQFKIPPRDISKLLAAGSLVLEDGSEVKAQQIKEPDSPGPAFLILHYSSTHNVQEILNNPIFLDYLKAQGEHTYSIIHIIENKQQQIVESPQFAQLLSCFPNKVKHIVYNRHYRDGVKVLEEQGIPKHLQLVSFVHKYFPSCMPDVLGQHQDFISNHLAHHCRDLEQIHPGFDLLAYRRCYELIIAPRKSQGYVVINEGQTKKEQKQLIVPQPIQIPNFADILTEKQLGFLSKLDPEVVFLGTGSMKPSKYRNVSSIFIKFDKLNSILLDCGEGSYYQLFNHYGKQLINQTFMGIRIIFITHIHSDHNLGILDLINQRNKLIKEACLHMTHQQKSDYIAQNKLFLIIPCNVLPWFHSYITHIEDLTEQHTCEVLLVQTILGEAFEQSDSTVSKDEKYRQAISSDKHTEMKDERDQIDAETSKCGQQSAKVKVYLSAAVQQLHNKYIPTQEPIFAQFKQYLQLAGIQQFLPVHVEHCPESFAVVIQHQSEFKVSYSGDCRPCPQFASLAKQSTLMIHEATFGDDLEENARQNMHSTVGEAIDIAMSSGSYKLALTHFSQRYISAKQIIKPSLYKFDECKRKYAECHSIVCFDHLGFKMSQLPQMPYFSRAISEVFPSDSQE